MIRLNYLAYPDILLDYLLIYCPYFIRKEVIYIKKTFHMRLFSLFFRIHNRGEEAIKNAQQPREKAYWAAISGLSRAGVYWLS